MGPRAEQAATFERAARRLLARLPDGDDRAQLRAFARWHQHQRLLARERPRSDNPRIDRHELAQLRAGVQLAAWATNHGHTLKTIAQHDLDRWLAEGPPARRRVDGFLAWAARARRSDPLTVAPIAISRHTDQLPADARVALVGRLLEDDTLDLRDRVGGLLVLWLAQPASRLLMLSTAHIDTTRDPVTIRLGREPLELPQPLGQLVTELVRQRAADGAALAAGTPPWLFAGARRARPLSEQQFTRRLQRLGIPTLAARTGALMGLAAQTPPAILADLLGLCEQSAAHLSQQAAGDWTRYAAHRPTAAP